MIFYLNGSSTPGGAAHRCHAELAMLGQACGVGPGLFITAGATSAAAKEPSCHDCRSRAVTRSRSRGPRADARAARVTCAEPKRARGPRANTGRACITCAEPGRSAVTIAEPECARPRSDADAGRLRRPARQGTRATGRLGPMSAAASSRDERSSPECGAAGDLRTGRVNLVNQTGGLRS